jgi:3-hydroxyisobutyrate dehydrogenase-like beta-hydroxyacid dehydrogenase
MKVALVGTGIMGSGMADHFMKEGYEVYVWNRSPENAQKLIDQGAIATSTPKEATEKADMIFEVTANDESSRAVWLGDEGILAGASSDKILIVSATLSAQWVDELSGLCNEKEFTFFDMPLTGGRMAAESGSLTLLIGGDKQKLEEIKPVLDAISSKMFHFGPAGTGTRFKLLLNMIQGIHIDALGETLKVAQNIDMDMKAVGDALADRPGGVMTNLAWQCYQQKPNPINFSVNWITKDLRYAKKLAEGLNTPLLDDTLAKYEEAINRELGDGDWTEITRF